MRGDELTNYLGPRVDYFSFMQALTKSEALHQLRNQLRRRLPAVGPHFSLRQAAPFGDHCGTERGLHENHLATDKHRVNTNLKHFVETLVTSTWSAEIARVIP